jgi:hypothetical protein
MNERETRLRFSAQHGRHEAPLLWHLLVWLVLAAGVTVVATVAQLLAAAAIAGGAVVGVGSLMWVCRWVQERHEDAVDVIEGARWWAAQQAQNSQRLAELSPGEPGPRELTR